MGREKKYEYIKKGYYLVAFAKDEESKVVFESFVVELKPLSKSYGKATLVACEVNDFKKMQQGEPRYRINKQERQSESYRVPFTAILLKLEEIVTDRFVNMTRRNLSFKFDSSVSPNSFPVIRTYQSENFSPRVAGLGRMKQNATHTV